MDQTLASREMYGGTVYAIKRTVDDESFYILQGIGLTGKVVNEKAFTTLEEVLEVFNRLSRMD